MSHLHAHTCIYKYIHLGCMVRQTVIRTNLDDGPTSTFAKSLLEVISLFDHSVCDVVSDVNLAPPQLTELGEGEGDRYKWSVK